MYLKNYLIAPNRIIDKQIFIVKTSFGIFQKKCIQRLHGILFQFHLQFSYIHITFYATFIMVTPAIHEFQAFLEGRKTKAAVILGTRVAQGDGGRVVA